MKAHRYFGMGFLMSLLLIAGSRSVGAQERILFNNTNSAAVRNGGAITPRFLLNVPTTITQVVTYHWNDGRGALPGRISLRGVNNQGVPNGQFFGPYSTTGTSGSGVPNVNWVTNLNLNVPGGFYEVVDSEGSTWSNNFQSASQGFAIVRGYERVTPSPPPPPPPGGGGSGSDLFNNTNTSGVRNGPTASPQFTLASSAVITQLVTYHWNLGQGARPGYISLQMVNGPSFGTFSAFGTAGSGVQNANWVANVNVTVPAGTYLVIDSDRNTWSNNNQSGFQGFAIVRGSLQPTPSPKPPACGPVPAVYRYGVKYDDYSRYSTLSTTSVRLGGSFQIMTTCLQFDGPIVVMIEDVNAKRPGGLATPIPLPNVKRSGNVVTAQAPLFANYRNRTYRVSLFVLGQPKKTAEPGLITIQ